MVTSTKNQDQDPPLVSFQVTNPVTYFKKWWKKIMANEGVDLRLKIKPLTAIAISIVIASAGFGLGWLTIPIPEPIIKYVPQLAPSPTPSPWKETAYTGKLKFSISTNKYYLLTEKSEAITLEVPSNVKLDKLIGKRIFATGELNTLTGILKVNDATDMEILPITVTNVPTVATTSAHQ